LKNHVNIAENSGSKDTSYNENHYKSSSSIKEDASEGHKDNN